MPTVSTWLSPSKYTLLVDFAEYLNTSPSKLVKQIIEDKLRNVIREDYIKRVDELYKWFLYEGDFLPYESYVKRILKNSNAEAILSILSLQDELRVLLKVLGMLMLTVSSRSYASENEDITIIKSIKYKIIDEIKSIRVYHRPLQQAKTLWIACVDKIRDASINNRKDWQRYAFTCAFQAIRLLGDESIGEVYMNLG